MAISTSWSSKDDRLKGILWDLDADGYDHIDFFYIPEEITDELTPEWNEIQIIGRSSPIQAYGSTGAHQLSLELNFFAEEDARREVFQKVMWIQSLKYPEYIGKRMKPPHRVSLIIGSFIALEGIVKNAGVTWKAPFETDTKYPMLATVQLSVTEVTDTPADYQQIRQANRIGTGSTSPPSQGSRG